jgi:Rieske Fe-S protein
VAPALFLAACGGAAVRVERVTAAQGVAILPVSQIADVHGPAAMKLEGADSRLPVWLHADRHLDWHVVAGRCHQGDCEVEYDADDDVFECECTGDEYGPDGQPLDGGTPLVTYPVDYRNQTILIELRPAR